MIGDISGNPCPRCGCCDTRVVDSIVRFGTAIERVECRYCGQRFAPAIDHVAASATAPEPSDVAYQARCLCPKCSAADPAVQRTLKKGTATIRYHRCECGHRFRSVQAGAV